MIMINTMINNVFYSNEYSKSLLINRTGIIKTNISIMPIFFNANADHQ